MSDLPDLLELMHTSARRWQTLQASGWEWHHLVRARDAWQRLMPPGRSRSVTFLGRSIERPEPQEIRESWQLWLAQPDKTRAEFQREDDTVTAVIVGETWWSWSASRGVTTNGGDPQSSHGKGPGEALIDPASILPAVEFVVTGRATFIERPVVEVVASPTAIDDNDEESSDWRLATHGLGGGADEFALLVDAERGVLLRSEARIGGEPFRILEMEAVIYDEEFAPDVFSPPAGQEIEPAWVPRSVSLDELPHAVPFTVLVPEHPPFGVDDVDIFPPDRQHGVPEQVHIAFASSFFGEDDRQFWLVESAEPFPGKRAVEWQKTDDMRFGEDRDIDPPLRVVQLKRFDTHVEVRSYYLKMEELLGLARQLVPLRQSPPPLHPSQ